MRSKSLGNVRSLLLLLLIFVLALVWPIGASAQTLTPPTPQFAFTGFIQEATLDTAGVICTPAAQGTLDVSRLRGGTITVNGVKMIVPCNSIIQLPAATFTWADLFDPLVSAPVNDPSGTTVIGQVDLNGAPVTAPVQAVGQTKLALADNPMPFPSFDVSVNGNVVGKNADGTDRYVVGLIVPIEQQVLNGSSGIVTYIDYKFGSLRVGGNGATGCDATRPGGGPLCTGTLLQINDPVGRWGLVHSIDPRFSGDFENTTIHASTGIPVCIPRVAPPANDPLCPMFGGPQNTGNRPLNGDPRFPSDPFLAPGAPLKNFTMPAPVCAAGTGPGTLTPCANTVAPDAYQQVPIMVGDQLNYIGTQYKINPLAQICDPITGVCIPDNTPANTYMSVHTVDDVLGVFTAPGVPPAYVTIEAFLIGSGGAALPGLLQEASTRLTVVGFTTDPTRLVDIYAIDVNPCTGQESLRLLATTDPATQPLVGRFVHRVLGGLFMPPTRMYVMKSRTQALDPLTGLPVPLIAANGIATGQFALPNFEYVFPENHRLGDPFIPNNYQDLPFLALGSGPVNAVGIPGAKIGDPTSPVLGQLNPWPGIPAPAPVTCSAFGTAPVVIAQPDVAVSTGATFTLSGKVTWDANDDPLARTATWVDVGTGTALATTVTTVGTTSTVTASFSAPATPTTLTFRLDAADNFGPGTGDSLVNITVLQPTDTVQFVLATFVIQRGQRGGFGKLTVQATTSDPTAILSLSQVDTAGQVTNWGAGANSPNTPTVFDWIENKGATQPVSLTITSTKGGSATVTCGAPNAKGTITCP